MRDFGKVHTSFWTSDTTRGMSEDARTLAMYLLTSPHGTIAGVFRLPDGYACDDLQWDGARVQAGFAALAQNGFALRCEVTKWVWVINHFTWNSLDNPNQRTAARKVADMIPRACTWLGDFVEQCGPVMQLEVKPARDPSPTVPTTPLITVPQTVTQTVPTTVPQTVSKSGAVAGEGEVSKPKPTSPSGDGGDVVEEVKPFDQFWAAYPWNAGKQDAQKAWIKVEKNWAKLNAHDPEADMLATLLAAIEAQKGGADWLRDGGQYIPRAATWLNGGRWLDEVRPYTPPPPKLPQGWWESKEGLEKAGAMLTPPLTPRPGEYPKDFAARIRAALGRDDTPPGDAAAPVPVAPAPYIPPAPAEGVQLDPEQLQARRDELREAMKVMSAKAGNARAGVAPLSGAQAA
jgi:hypothetical protein